MAASTYFDQIQQLYIAYFGRPADPVGLTFWATQVDAANGSVAAVIAGFAASSESNALYAGVPTAQKVSAIYLNLFNRLPEAAGLAYWTQQIDSGTVTQAQAAYQIQSSAGPGDASAVANKLAMAKAFTVQIDTTAEISGYNGAIAAAYGRAYLASIDSTPASVSTATTNLLSSVATATGTTLTTPVTPTAPVTVPGITYVLTTASDNLTTAGAGDDTFIGTIDTTTSGNSTLNFKDYLDGGAGSDTLTVTVQGNSAATWPTVNVLNIERLLISDTHTGGSTSTYNLSGATALSTVTSNVSTAAVSFSGLQTGTTVAVAGNNVNSLGNVSFSMATATDAITLQFDGGVKGSPNVTSGNSATSKATISSTGATANTLGTVTLNSTASNTITSLSINASADLTTTLLSTDYASTGTLTVTGTGKVNLGTSVGFDGAQINAATNSGGLTIALDTNNIQSVVGSSGADRILGSSHLTGATSIDGGAGIDTMSAALVFGNGAIFKNFELLDLGAGANNGVLDVAQLSNSTITGVVLSGNAVAPAVVLNNLVDTPTGFNVSLTANSSSSNLTLNFNNVTGTNDVLNFDFAGVASTQGSAGTLTAQGIETINIKSGGLAASTNSLTITDTALKSLVITGSEQTNLTLTAQNAVGGSSSLTSIDGSATTGYLQVSVATPAAGVVQSALSIKGGSGAGVFTVTTSSVVGSVGVTVETGAGNDLVVVSGATVRDTTTPQFTTLVNPQAGDTLQFGAATSFNSGAIVIAGGQTLAQALNTATSLTNNTAQWFLLNNEAYIVFNGITTGGFDATDIVVKITGVTDLSGMTGGGGTTLTFV